MTHNTPTPKSALNDGVSIVIVTHNSGPLLLKTLASISSSLGQTPPEVIVVDNGSSDGSFDVAQQAYPALRYVNLDVNRGFGAANNVGVRQTNRPNVLFLNPDAELQPGAVEQLVAFLQNNPVAAAVGPKLLNSDGSLQLSFRSFPTFSTAIANRYSLLTRLFPNNPLSRRYLHPAVDETAGGEVDWVSGACVLVRREAGDAVGWFDEGYFLFCEDVDLCRRLSLNGWTVHYLPAAEVVHHIGISKSTPSLKVIAERHRSMWRYYTKFFHRSWWKDMMAAAAIMLRFAFTALRAFLTLR